MANSFKPGDKATYVHSICRRGNCRMTVRDVTVLEVTDDVATVKKGNGRREKIHVSHLTPASEPNALTQAFQKALGDD